MKKRLKGIMLYAFVQSLEKLNNIHKNDSLTKLKQQTDHCSTDLYYFKATLKVSANKTSKVAC